MAQDQKPKFHPSFGYATEEEVNKLNALPIGAERATIMDRIKKRAGGKKKKK